MLEYIQNKRRNATDFQLRMCQVDFNQSGTQRKSYQDIQERKIKIHFKELCRLFSSTENDGEKVELDDEDHSILEKAFSISKSVPRKSGRSIWRENALHPPTMMVQADNTGVLLQGDMVFHRAIDESVDFYQNQKDFELCETKSRGVKNWL